MKIGFTGTRRGMSLNQKRQFRYLLAHVLQGVDEFHHGAAVGADKEAEKIFCEYQTVEMAPSSERIRRHPARLEPLVRNRKIVRNSDVLIAAPATDHEVLRSGTWATIRYAKKKGIAIIQLPRTGKV